MKTKFLLSSLLSFSFYLLSSQVPQGFNYQAIARDGSGNPITGTTMQVKIGILSDTIANTMVWEELFDPVKTNAFGLFNIIVGTGVKQSGSAATFSVIDWTKTPLFLRTSVYYPSSWKVMGTSKLQSVPYSMVAGNLKGAVPLLSVKSNTATMDSALFVVRNNTGQIVFAVYNEGVRIYVDDGLAKSTTKGGFAIGGFGTGKGASHPLFIVDPDSIRAYVDTTKVKGVKKGGFAIGSFDNSKGILSNFMEMTPKNYFIGEGSGSVTTGLYNSFIGYQTGKMNTIGGNNAFMGYQSGYNNVTGSNNLFLGYQSGYNNTSGSFNSFVGYMAGSTNSTGVQNSFLGSYSGANNSTGGNNTFVGYNSGYKNSTGSANNFIGTNSGYSNTEGISNVFIGPQSGYSNTSGAYNIYIGSQAGMLNSIGYFNISIGFQAGLTSTSSYNCFLGYFSGTKNTTGQYNSFVGFASGMSNQTGVGNTFLGSSAGEYNTTGNYNSFIGADAGEKNTSADDNVFIGMDAGYLSNGPYNVYIGVYAGTNSTSGSNNTFLGDWAGNFNKTGSNNTMVGSNADVTSDALNNAAAIGYLARVDASNKVVIGNSSVTNIGGYANWTNYSDRRMKENINYRDDLGLNFISRLKTASFNYIADENKRRHDGLIAQDVQQTLKDLGIDFSGLVIDDNEARTLNLAYGDFVVPLINAVKELDKKDLEQQKQIESQQKEIDELKALVNTIAADQKNN